MAAASVGGAARVANSGPADCDVLHSVPRAHSRGPSSNGRGWQGVHANARRCTDWAPRTFHVCMTVLEGIEVASPPHGAGPPLVARFLAPKGLREVAQLHRPSGSHSDAWPQPSASLVPNRSRGTCETVPDDGRQK